MVRLMSGLLRLRNKFQNSLLLDHVVKTAYQRGGRIGVPALFGFARHGRALTGESPEHAQIVGSV